jgi:hypothetical protein
MRRALSIAAVLLLLAQAMAASSLMLHPGMAVHDSAHMRVAHDCCPPLAVLCAHPNHGAGACCCTGSEESAVPARDTAPAGPALRPTADRVASPPALLRHAAISSRMPSDHSPPVLVLRN